MTRVEVSVGHQTKKSAKRMWKQLFTFLLHEPFPNYVVSVSTNTLVYLLYAAGDLLQTCCISFSVIDMVDGRRHGEVCVWGGLSSNFVFISNGLIYKAFTLQRYGDKKHTYLFRGTRVKYLDHEERAGIVCMSQYM